jgi:hypothetical protein
VARALHPALNWAEIALRNYLDAVIGSAFPIGGARSFARVKSWLDAEPPVILPKEQEKVQKAKDDIDCRAPHRAAHMKSRGRS